MVFLPSLSAVSIDNRGGGWDRRWGGVGCGGVSGVGDGNNPYLGHPMSELCLN